jgi:hypothetical protein
MAKQKTLASFPMSSWNYRKMRKDTGVFGQIEIKAVALKGHWQPMTGAE